MPDWREQEATNQTIFREMNEWTEEANDRHVGRGHAIDAYLCECSDRGCSEPIDLTPRIRVDAVGRHALRDRRRSREPGDRPGGGRERAVRDGREVLRRSRGSPGARILAGPDERRVALDPNDVTNTSALGPGLEMPSGAPALEVERPRARGGSGVSFLVACPAGLVLVAVAPTTGARVAVAVYALALIAVFWVSSMYHRHPWPVEERARWQRRDRAAITC